ncbi:glycerate kinase [Cognatishimia sp. SS12]|uniref:glycerate kinase type-2 family protein n=1 Tax=Cognatishimia sp. SS12 TaxID=2979465 RepID=UPI00232B6003|nr:glycerate kinase [Cognatishimia sp. SS12]MDC0738844.1 glycerate kinase [Cognatishimia sp. SS12]
MTSGTPTSPPTAATADRFLRGLFDTAVAVADPLAVIPDHLPPRPKGRLIVVGAGKASARMAEAVEAHYGPCEGLVITRYGYARPTQGIKIIEAAHPVPDAAGVAATVDMLALLGTAGPKDHVLALISGGGSALLCAPAFGLTLAEKQAINAALLASGAPIGDMNVLRKHLSLVKGGQLAAAAAPAKMLSLMISDVPGDSPAAIASGPTVGDDSRAADALAIAERYGISLPDKARAGLAAGSSVRAVGDPALATCDNRVIAAPSQSLAAAAKAARAAGCDVQILGDDLEGEARDLAAHHAGLARELRAKAHENGRPMVLLSGGECTVTRRGSGVGGPNAEYVLAAALALDGAEGIHVLACDTDGVDGAAEVAGASVGPEVLHRAGAAGLSPTGALAENDAHTFFDQLSAQVVTGPTLTNVNDFRAFLILPMGG